MTSDYVYFNGARLLRRDNQNHWYYYFTDQIHSTRVIAADNIQRTTLTLCYDADFYPYGGELRFTDTCLQNYKFDGKERDTETGNDYFGARYYSSTYGRFLSADWSSVPAPVPYANLTNPQTLNLYAFVSDNPESFADLNGHCTVEGTNHGWVWCALHKVGVIHTDAEWAAIDRRNALELFKAAHIAVVDEQGNHIDPATLSTEQIEDFNDQWCRANCKYWQYYDSGMLGALGTRVTSHTLWEGENGHIDVENPNPGQRPGQIHFQDDSGKYIYDIQTNSFRGAPNAVNELLQREDVQRAIQTGLRYLGVQQ